MRLSLVSAIILAAYTFAAQSYGQEELSATPIDITTIDGKKYSRCKIIRVEPDGLVIMHEIGVKKLPFAELPNDLRQEHEVRLPWFIKPEVAAHYWPTSIDDVLNIIAPEISIAQSHLDKVLSSNATDIATAKSVLKNTIAANAPEISSAKANLDQASKELETSAEAHDMNYWYKQWGSDYTYLNGKLTRAGPDITRLRGKVLSVANPTHVFIIDNNNEITAGRLQNTAGLSKGAALSSLGRPIGTYKYSPASGPAVKVKYFELLPCITIEEFKKSGESAFPEIEEAKRTQREALAKNERMAREALIKIETAAAKSQFIAEETLAKVEAGAAEAERVARERLLNAGVSTYERLLTAKKMEEDAQIRLRASTAAQKAQEQDKYDQELEIRNRGIKAAQEAETRRALEAQQKRFRIKGPDDFN